MAKTARTTRPPPVSDRSGGSLGPLVAIVIDPSLPYDREIARGVAQYAREVGDWRLYVEEEQGRRLPDLAAWHGQGIIASFDDEAVARQVSAARLPVVAVGGGQGVEESKHVPYVATDNERIAVLAAEHLLERALEQFGFYGLPPAAVTSWSAARAAAFATRLTAAGHACQTLITRHDSTSWSLLQAELMAWLTALPTPVGIMACDDLRARHVLEACRTLGLRVPHDVAVIGVDDDDFICELSDPPLSSVAQAARQIGHTAARLLDTLMRRRPGRPDTADDSAAVELAVPRLTVVPPLCVVSRRSTDTLAVNDPEIATAIRLIRERATQGLGIAEIVRASRLSRWQLEDRFRRTVGRSLHDDIREVRLAEARRLVTTTNLPLKAVAERAGFRSITYMTTLFRRRFDTTPAALRTASQGHDRRTATP